ncbi:MAG: VWA domain-containing protein, partial [Chloroflexi bacterium CFX6]|nr:VWA domain-containing protein [Chloroflexi bacterium CFX6]
GTRIDRGLAVAVAELDGPRRRAGNTPVIVLLTDGRQDDDPLVAIDVAGRARSSGKVVFAIGLGGDVDTAFLELIAGGRPRTFLAPTPADLARIYTQVAGEVPCPSEVYWGGRR